MTLAHKIFVKDLDSAVDRWKKDLGRAHSLVGKYSKHGRIQAVTGHGSKNNFDLDLRCSKKCLSKSVTFVVN